MPTPLASSALGAGHASSSYLAFQWALLAGVGALAGHLIAPRSRGALIGALATTGWEATWWLRRLQARRETYDRALAHARRVGLPLAVIGAPDRGTTNGMCGDLVIDIAPSHSCPNTIQADITKSIPLPDNSVVVFIPYVLEYVSDLDAAVREIRRVAGDRVYMLSVQPWTATAHFYQGAKRVVPSNLFTTPPGRECTTSLSGLRRVPNLSASKLNTLSR